MPLAIRYEQGFVPIVLCDQCGKEITSAADGNYQWLWEDLPSRIYFTHKACCYAFEKRHGGRWCAGELRVLPVYLVNNLGIDWKKANVLADYLARW